jgi:hypothetical protein
MSVAQVYITPPIFPRFVAVDTDFAGTNIVYEGVKNPSLNLQNREYEIVEGINVVRGRFQIYTTPVGNIPAQILGTFWVYATAPYPDPIFMTGLEGYQASLSNDYPNLIDWDVYNHYVNTNIYQSTTPIQTSSIPTFLQSTAQDIRTSTDNYPENYYAGKWDWDWSWYNGSSFDGINDNYINVFQMKTFPTVVSIGRANYIDLLRGYPPDNRMLVQRPVIIPAISEKIEISYYRENKMESVEDLQSIDWMFYDCQLQQGVPYTLPIVDCCLGTLYLSSQSVKSQILNTVVPNNYYNLKYFLNENLPDLFAEWNQGQLATNNILRVIGANNNHWNNKPTSTSDLNFDITHPMFAIDNQRAYNWHIKPQIDGSYGDLIMDSPRTIETRLMVEQLIKALNALEYQNETPAIIGTGTIDNPQTPATHKLDWYIKNSAGEKVTAIWKALGGNKYGTNSIDNTKERVTNLGFLVERIAKVLGIRFDDNGKIDVDKEKSMVRKVIDGSQNIDPEKVGINGYGDGGMVVKRINNRFKKKGEIVSDQCVVLQDMPDLIQEYFEQANLALGIQESSAIEIKQDGTAARFNNQLEILIELLNLLSSGNQMTRAALVSSLVTQSQTNELIAGLGLPSVTKTIPVKIDKKVQQVPFKGIAAHRSISQEIATCTYNVGIALGQLL